MGAVSSKTANSRDTTNGLSVNYPSKVNEPDPFTSLRSNGELLNPPEKPNQNRHKKKRYSILCQLSRIKQTLTPRAFIKGTPSDTSTVSGDTSLSDPEIPRSYHSKHQSTFNSSFCHSTPEACRHSLIESDSSSNRHVSFLIQQNSSNIGTCLSSPREFLKGDKFSIKHDNSSQCASGSVVDPPSSGAASLYQPISATLATKNTLLSPNVTTPIQSPPVKDFFPSHWPSVFPSDVHSTSSKYVGPNWSQHGPSLSKTRDSPRADRRVTNPPFLTSSYKQSRDYVDGSIPISKPMQQTNTKAHSTIGSQNSTISCSRTTTWAPNKPLISTPSSTFQTYPNMTHRPSTYGVDSQAFRTISPSASVGNTPPELENAPRLSIDLNLCSLDSNDLMTYYDLSSGSTTPDRSVSFFNREFRDSQIRSRLESVAERSNDNLVSSGSHNDASSELGRSTVIPSKTTSTVMDYQSANSQCDIMQTRVPLRSTHSIDGTSLDGSYPVPRRRFCRSQSVSTAFSAMRPEEFDTLSDHFLIMEESEQRHIFRELREIKMYLLRLRRFLTEDDTDSHGPSPSPHVIHTNNRPCARRLSRCRSFDDHLNAWFASPAVPLSTLQRPAKSGSVQRTRHSISFGNRRDSTLSALQNNVNERACEADLLHNLSRLRQENLRLKVALQLTAGATDTTFT